MALPLIAWAGIGLASLAGYKLLGGSSERYLGDKAKVGDVVFVAPSFLSQATLPQLPPGTLYVGIKVEGGDRERVQGGIVAFGDQMLPTTGVGSFVVQRKDIFKIMRDGKVIAFQPGAKIGAEG
jgi:hypothetical protein